MAVIRTDARGRGGYGGNRPPAPTRPTYPAPTPQPRPAGGGTNVGPETYPAPLPPAPARPPATGPTWGPDAPQPPAPPTPTGPAPTPWNPHNLPGPPGRPGTLPTNTVPPTSFYEQVTLLYPWLPDELAQLFADSWTQYGNEQLALAAVRQSAAYQRYFPGNRRADGSIRLAEQEYLSTITGYGAVLGRYGLAGDMFSGRFVQLLENEVSVDEFNARLSMIQTGLVDRADQVRQFYYDTYIATDPALAQRLSSLSNEALFASAMDPEGVGNDIFQGRITNAQIGGWARYHGFGVSSRPGLNPDGANDELRRIDELRKLGVTEAQAKRLYGQASMEVPQLGEFANRYGDQRGFGIYDYENFGFAGQADPTRRRQQLIARERSAWSQAAAFSQNREGGMTGLQAR